MKQPIGRGRLARLSAIVVTSGLVLGSMAISSAEAATAAKRKPLSLTNITITVPTVNFMAVELAKQMGYFKQQGLNATVTISSGTAAGNVTLLVAGATDFLENASSATAIAIQGGATIKSIMATNYLNNQQIVINAQTAAAHNIPVTSGNATQALAQLNALKGSHLNLGVSNTTSDAYIFLKAEAQIHGLSIGPNGDINITSLGSTQSLLSGLGSGKIDGYVNSPPVTTQAPISTDTIQLWRIAPIPKAYWDLISTSNAMIQGHPDTVQAAVNATAEGWNYLKAHPKSIQRLATLYYASPVLGISSPEEISYLVTDLLQHTGASPAMFKSGYQVQKQLINIALPSSPVSVSFSQWMTNKYINKAIKTFHYKYPLGN